MKTDLGLSKKITVIGGGPAGMVAAIFAARKLGGHNVRLLEKNEKLGRKLLATGNGRCNITNRNSHMECPSSVQEAFKQMNVESTLDFFKGLGILTREESEGRLYPYSEQAISVQQALIAELTSLNVEIICQVTVKKLEKTPDGFNLLGEIEKQEKIRQNKEVRYATQKVIIATGGKAGPQYGSTGDGYAMAKEFGHSIVKLIPSLTQITSEQSFFKELKGVRAKGSVTLLKRSKPLDMETGEIQFTENGLSGICIFNLTRLIRLEDNGYADYTVKIDLMPEFSSQELNEFLIERTLLLQNRKTEEFLNGMINGKLSSIILKEAGFDEKTMRTLKLSQLTKKQVQEVAKHLKGWELSISGTKGWKEAQITCGGIDMAQLNVETLESKLVKGLYFAGEVTDIDGKCGGYNLQWAWTSGYVAGTAASTDCE